MVPTKPSSQIFQSFSLSEVTLLYQSLSPAARWLKSVMTVKCKFTSAPGHLCVWRRLQMNEQQAERQRKNVLQKVLTFASRAHQLQFQDQWTYFETMGHSKKRLATSRILPGIQLILVMIPLLGNNFGLDFFRTRPPIRSLKTHGWLQLRSTTDTVAPR